MCSQFTLQHLTLCEFETANGLALCGWRWNRLRTFCCLKFQTIIRQWLEICLLSMKKWKNKTAQKTIMQVKWFCMWCCWVSGTKELFQRSGVSSQDIPSLRFGPNNLGHWRWVKLECRRHSLTAIGREAQWELQLNIYDSYDSRNDSKFSGWIPRHRWPRSSRFLCRGTIQKSRTQILFFFCPWCIVLILQRIGHRG